MFTIFDDELDSFTRTTLSHQRSFQEGKWEIELLHSHRWQCLRRTLSYVKDNSKFYSVQLASLSHDQIAHLDAGEFAQTVPFTRKQDLQGTQESMLSKPLSRSWVYYETTGTTGAASPCPRDHRDSITNTIALTVCYESVLRQHGTDQVIAVLGPAELHSTADTFTDVCRNLGYSVVKMWPYSPVVGFKRALRLLADLRVSTMFCTPGMAITLAKQALASGVDPASEFGVRCLMLVGELASPGLLKTIENVWNARAYDCMLASQEASILAAVHADGRLRSIPLNIYYEIVDPVSGIPVAPAGHGWREGELVISHLYQGSKPLVRYRTGDLVRFEPAELTRPYPSETVTPLGRVRDRIRLNGQDITAFDLENRILSNATGCLDYYVTVDRDAKAEQVVVELEMLPGRTTDVRDISELLSGIYGCRVSIRLSTLGQITSTGALVSWKAARIQDLRASGDHEQRTAMSIARERALK